MPTLYDCHTHLGVDLAFYLRHWWPYGENAQNLLAKMDAGSIRHAVCFPMVISSAFDPYAFANDDRLELLPGRFPYDRENPALLAELEHVDTKQRLLPFAMFDPHRAVPEQLTALDKLVGRIHGLKTQTTVPRVPIRDLLDGGRDLMAFAEQHNLPVLFHTAVHPDDPWAQVRDCLDVAEAYPDVRFNLAHSLRFDRPMLERAAEAPNVWVDCSAHLIHCDLATRDLPAVAPSADRVDADYRRPEQVLEAIYDILGDRYIWGSDNPAMSWCDSEVRVIRSYKQETECLHALNTAIKQSMAQDGPVAWLKGD